MRRPERPTGHAGKDCCRDNDGGIQPGRLKRPQRPGGKDGSQGDLALDAAQSADLELRDTATRALGKFVESIPPAALPVEFHRGVIERVRRNLGDPNPGIRAKAIRTWGKMAKGGHLTPAEREELRWVCQRLLGVDEAFDWDRAYIVRKQAEDALQGLG